MKLKKRVFCLLMAATMLIGILLEESAFAATSTKYAYSIGVNHASTDELTGNFTKNVMYAATCYGMMDNFVSYYQTSPSVLYLRTERNPNGVRKLASDVVFLNGHGNNTSIVFGKTLGSGVYYGYNAYSTNYQYAGLKSIGSMSTVDLISFVGCSTAGGSSNLPSVAVELGATTAVGFTDNIIYRFNDGPRWLQRYNDYLAQGYTVRQAVNYASACYPDCTLSLYVKIYGSTSNTISSGMKSGSSASVVSKQDAVAIDIEVGNVENCIEIPASECSFVGFDAIAAKIEEISPEVDLDECKVSANMYSDNGLDGIIIVKYYIGDEIATNKAYIVSVEDGTAVNVIPSEAVSDTAIPLAMDNMNQDEENFLQALEWFEMQVASGGLPEAVKEENDIPQDAALVETRGGYHYDYLTGELCYTEEYFYLTPGKMGVYIDDVATWIIN